MSVVLDTAALPECDRADAFHGVLNTASQPACVQPDPDAPRLCARIEYTRLGRGVDQLRTTGSGFVLERTRRHVRLAAPELVALAIHSRGPYALQQGQVATAGSEASLQLLDLSSPYRYEVRDAGVGQSVAIDLTLLGLPLDVVRHAAPRLRDSALYPLVREHVLRLPDAAASVEGTTAAAELGASTVALARALVTTAIGDDARSREALNDSLVTRILAFIEQHLAEVDLTPARIAAEHNVSVRHLHRTFEVQGVTVSAWIASRRLEAVRRDLADPRSARAGVAAVARRWGFVNAAHFTRRFREEYGVTPTQWRDLSAAPLR